MSGKFEPEQFEDRYENALIELIRSKQKGMPIKPQPTHRTTNVINLMDALRRSVEGETKGAAKSGAQKAEAKKAESKQSESKPKAARKGKARIRKAG
jgi:DNA end-binding protein Ku